MIKDIISIQLKSAEVDKGAIHMYRKGSALSARNWELQEKGPHLRGHSFVT